MPLNKKANQTKPMFTSFPSLIIVETHEYYIISNFKFDL